MAFRKAKPCPNCKTDDHIAVYTYDSGWRHVECMKCNYLGPGEGSIKAAIQSHNERATQIANQRQENDQAHTRTMDC